jgi:TetR/AcrR family transcriptional regulator, tetracycline repressor protein
MVSSTTDRKRLTGPKGARRPTGRSGRRRTLTRDQVVREALALLDRDGLEIFSVRRLADRLGVTPMAVYNHVSSKRDLLQAVAEAVVTEAEYRPAKGDWQSTVRGCFRTLREACLAHPGAVPLVESADLLPTAIFRPMEITLTALHAAGLGTEDAVRAYYVLTTFTLGQVKYQMRGWSRGVDPAVALSEGQIDAAAFPAIARAAVGEPWDFEKFFEFGLSVILVGLDTVAKRSRRPRG